MFKIHQRIDVLERLLSNNNRLVERLRDSLLQHKSAPESGGGGVNASFDSAHSQHDPLPGCRLVKEMKDGANGVQVSMLAAAGTV